MLVYRLGLATTRRQARRFVNHGHIHTLTENVLISLRLPCNSRSSDLSSRKSAKSSAILEAVKLQLDVQHFVSFDAANEGSLTRIPERVKSTKSNLNAYR